MSAQFRNQPIGCLVGKIMTWNPREAAHDTQFAYIDISSLDQELKRVNGVQTVSAHQAPSRARQLVSKDDVLVSTVRPNLNAVAIVPGELNGATASTGFCVLRPNPDRLWPRYLYYWVRSPQFVENMTSRATGASYPAVTDAIVRESDVPLPPLPEQKRIAAILDKADGIRRKRQRAIALTEELLRSTFFELFGDPVLNPKGWDIFSLGNLLTFLTSGSRGWAKYYSEAGKKFLRIQNIGRNELSLDDLAFVSPPASAESSRTKVKAGDVLLSITADLGRTAVVPCDVGEAHINQHLAILRTSGIEPIYLSQFLSSIGGQRQFQKLNRVGVKSGLNFDDIRSLQIVCPPRIEQHRFVDFWYRHRATLTKQERALNGAQELFGALSQRAFRGEL